MKEVQFDDVNVKAVQEFCCLEDMLCAGGGCELTAVTRCKSARGKFRLPLLNNCNLPLLTRGRVYSTCVRSVMLYAAETWAMTVATLNRPRRNDHTMIRWIYNVKASNENRFRLHSLKARTTRYRCDASLQQDEMVWTCRTKQRLDFSSTQAKRSCTESQANHGTTKRSLDTADPQNRSEWRRRLVKQTQSLG